MVILPMVTRACTLRVYAHGVYVHGAHGGNALCIPSTAEGSHAPANTVVSHLMRKSRSMLLSAEPRRPKHLSAVCVRAHACLRVSVV